MDLFTDMIKGTYRKIDPKNSNFCTTPGASPKKLTEKIARTLILGQGNVDELLTSMGKDKDGHSCDEKVCTHH